MAIDLPPQVVSAIVGGLAGGVVSFLSTLVQQRRQDKRLTRQLDRQDDRLERQISSQNQRRKAEFYFQKKAEVLLQLNTDLHEVYHNLVEETAIEIENNGNISKDDYDEITEKFQSCERSLHRSSIFLEEEKYQEIVERFQDFRTLVRYAEMVVDQEVQFDAGTWNNQVDDTREWYLLVNRILREEVSNSIDFLDNSDLS